MATGKRYYWIKLKESFMTSDTVDFLMSQENGAQYVVLYQMLCLKTINTEGRLSRAIGEIVIPYDVMKIQRDCKWFSVDTIRVALDLYKRFGLIYEEQDGTLVLADHYNMVGSETDYAEKNRAIRARQQAALLETGHNVPNDVSPDVTIDIRDKDIRDKRLDIRDERLEKETEGDRVTVRKRTTPARFTPPLVDEVQEFCADKGYRIDAQHFIDYYEANGWRVGRNPMKDWKAAVRMWASRDNGGTSPRAAYGNKPDLTQPDPRIAALEELKKKFAAEEGAQ